MNGSMRGRCHLRLPLGPFRPPWPGDPSVPSPEQMCAVQKPSSMAPQFLLRQAPLFSLLPDTIRSLPSGPPSPHRPPHLTKLEPLGCPGRGPKKGGQCAEEPEEGQGVRLHGGAEEAARPLRGRQEPDM